MLVVDVRSNRELPEGSESHQLETDPVRFLSSRYQFSTTEDDNDGRKKLPEYVVLFAPTAKKIDALLDRAHYIAVRRTRESRAGVRLSTADDDDADADPYFPLLVGVGHRRCRSSTAT